MTPAEHYTEAERLLAVAERWDERRQRSGAGNERYEQLNVMLAYARAQVHATLASAPSTVAGGGQR